MCISGLFFSYMSKAPPSVMYNNWESDFKELKHVPHSRFLHLDKKYCLWISKKHISWIARRNTIYGYEWSFRWWKSNNKMGKTTFLRKIIDNGVNRPLRIIHISTMHSYMIEKINTYCPAAIFRSTREQWLLASYDINLCTLHYKCMCLFL